MINPLDSIFGNFCLNGQEDVEGFFINEKKDCLNVIGKVLPMHINASKALIKKNIKNHKLSNKTASIKEKMDALEIDILSIQDRQTLKKVAKAVKHIEIVECLDQVSELDSIGHSIDSIVNYPRALINKNTIITGANKNWDPQRLLLGKHESLTAIGSEHLLLTTKLGDRIDATYLKASSLTKYIENHGGKKCVISIPGRNLKEKFEGAMEYKICCSNEDIPVVKLSWEHLEKYDMSDIEKSFKHIQVRALVCKEDDDIYIVKADDLNKLQTAGLYDNEKRLTQVKLEDIDSEENILLIEDEISGFHFEKFPDELEEILCDLDFIDAPWIFLKLDNEGYLVRKTEMDELYEAIVEGLTLEMFETETVDSQSGGTVILTMNQTQIYEQFGAEILTLALEGVNVMVYNNGGKGLSKGGTSEGEINQALEAVYRYVSSVKLVPDNKILAKGQCFGGAPTAWLGAQHPDINLMLDQTPANFNETAIQIKNSYIENGEITGLLKFISNSDLCDLVITKGMASYQLDELVQKNRGKQLIHFDIPDENGEGGDILVPDHHPEKLIKNCSDPTVTKNPGGVHVTHWFSNLINFKQIVKFMKNNKLATNLYAKLNGGI